MIWIIPKSLTSVCAPATAESTSDCVAASRICEQSLIRRSKRSRASCYLREWKAGRLTRLRFGLTSSLFLGENFATEWISSQAAIRASHSAAPGSDSAEKTLGISGPTSQMEFQFCDPGCASSRTSKDTSASDSEKSSSIWASLVTRRRGEYSARLNAARLINASGSSSWPTASARDWKDSPGMSKERDGNPLGRVDQLPRAVYHHSGPVSLASPSSDGSRPASWATPKASDPQHAGPNMRDSAGNYALPGQVAQWATPRNMTGGTCRNGIEHSDLNSQAGGKLNPRWVETLMGLPVGWVMPSCASPVTPESMSYASSETASFPQLPSEPSASS
jgi:hypothetical protein